MGYTESGKCVHAHTYKGGGNYQPPPTNKTIKTLHNRVGLKQNIKTQKWVPAFHSNLRISELIDLIIALVISLLGPFNVYPILSESDQPEWQERRLKSWYLVHCKNIRCRIQPPPSHIHKLSAGGGQTDLESSQNRFPFFIFAQCKTCMPFWVHVCCPFSKPFNILYTSTKTFLSCLI